MSVRDVGRFILISFRSVRLVQFTVQLGKTSVTVVRLPKFRFPPTPMVHHHPPVADKHSGSYCCAAKIFSNVDSLS